MGVQVLREVWRIVERRNGEIYKTEYVEDRWVDIPIDGPPNNDYDLMYVTVSRDIPTMRTV